MAIKFIKSIILFLILTSTSYAEKAETVSLKITVNNLRNSKGVIIFAIYNKDGSIPDEHYKKYYIKHKEDIKNASSSTVFLNLPKGKYAVNILHDENKNGEIDKGFILPIEGIGFSNYTSIGLTNKPNFKKASISLNEDKELNIKIIYL
jgi:uncharacterized protein (DUF2141 family)